MIHRTLIHSLFIYHHRAKLFSFLPLPPPRAGFTFSLLPPDNPVHPRTNFTSSSLPRPPFFPPLRSIRRVLPHRLRSLSMKCGRGAGVREAGEEGLGGGRKGGGSGRGGRGGKVERGKGGGDWGSGVGAVLSVAWGFSGVGKEDKEEGGRRGRGQARANWHVERGLDQGVRERVE